MIAIVITGVEFNCMEQKSQSKFLPWPEFEPRTSHLTVQHAARPLLRIFGSYHLCFYCQFVCQKILSSAIISCPKLFYDISCCFYQDLTTVRTDGQGVSLNLKGKDNRLSVMA